MNYNCHILLNLGFSNELWLFYLFPIKRSNEQTVVKLLLGKCFKDGFSLLFLWMLLKIYIRFNCHFQKENSVALPNFSVSCLGSLPFMLIPWCQKITFIIDFFPAVKKRIRKRHWKLEILFNISVIDQPNEKELLPLLWKYFQVYQQIRLDPNMEGNLRQTDKQIYKQNKIYKCTL